MTITELFAKVVTKVKLDPTLLKPFDRVLLERINLFNHIDSVDELAIRAMYKRICNA